MKDLLAFDNVVAGYGGAKVLHGISLMIGAGERVAILGRNSWARPRWSIPSLASPG